GGGDRLDRPDAGLRPRHAGRLDTGGLDRGLRRQGPTQMSPGPFGDLEPVRLPGRDIPPPTTISEAARAAPSEGAAGPCPARPAAHDLDAWREAIAGSAALWEPVAAAVLSATTSTVETRAIAGVTCHVAAPQGRTGKSGAGEGPLYLFIHGG